MEMEMYEYDVCYQRRGKNFEMRGIILAESFPSAMSKVVKGFEEDPEEVVIISVNLFWIGEDEFIISNEEFVANK